MPQISEKWVIYTHKFSGRGMLSMTKKADASAAAQQKGQAVEASAVEASAVEASAVGANAVEANAVEASAPKSS